jgi:hypothetical protein
LIVVALSSVANSYFHGKPIDVAAALSLTVLGGGLAGIFVSLIFTPREMAWNDETFSITFLFRGQAIFDWEQLEGRD